MMVGTPTLPTLSSFLRSSSASASPPRMAVPSSIGSAAWRLKFPQQPAFPAPTEPHSRKRRQPISSHDRAQRQPPASSFPSSPVVSSVARVHGTSSVHQWQHTQQAHTGSSSSFSNAAGPQHPRVAASHTPPTVQRDRASRYLSEGDRRAIIRRIERGEKQVALAKEYRVSRAAICNLYKNRKEVLTRVDRDPDAKHPKKHKPKPLAASSEAALSPPMSPAVASSVDEERQVKEEEEEELKTGDKHGLRYQHQLDSLRYRSHSPEPRVDRAAAPPKPFRVHDAAAHSRPITNLLRILRSEDTESPTFRHTADRLMRMLVEEAVAYVQHSQDSGVGVKMESPARDSFPGPATVDERDICGITMEEPNGTPVLLRALTNVLPLASTGAISLAADDVHSRSPRVSHGQRWHICTQVPERIDPRRVVLLLDLLCGTGERACSALQYLVREKRVAPSSIYFVTVNGSVSGLRNVHQCFPASSSVRELATISEQPWNHHHHHQIHASLLLPMSYAEQQLRRD